jgi:hypothetical protein
VVERSDTTGMESQPASFSSIPKGWQAICHPFGMKKNGSGLRRYPAMSLRSIAG